MSMMKITKIIIISFFISVTMLKSMEENDKKHAVKAAIVKTSRRPKIFRKRFDDPSVLSSSKCFECGIGLRSEKGKNVHDIRMHMINKCQICNDTIRTTRSKYHALYHNDQISSKQKCEACKLGFEHMRGKDIHAKIHVLDKVDRVCKDCNKKVHKKQIGSHKLFHNTMHPDDLKCVECQLGSINKSRYSVHMNNYHKKNSICPDCRHATTKMGKRLHENFHSSSIPDSQKCGECKIGFLNQKKFNQHKHKDNRMAIDFLLN